MSVNGKILIYITNLETNDDWTCLLSERAYDSGAYVPVNVLEQIAATHIKKYWRKSFKYKRYRAKNFKSLMFVVKRIYEEV